MANLTIKEAKKYTMPNGYIIHTIRGEDQKGTFYYVSINQAKKGSKKETALIEGITYRNPVLANLKYQEYKAKFSPKHPAPPETDHIVPCKELEDAALLEAEKPQKSIVKETKLPFLCDELRNGILCDKRVLRMKHEGVLLYYEEHDDYRERAAFLKSVYVDGIIDDLMIEGHSVGYEKQNDGLLLWEGSYETRTAENFFTWLMLQAYIGGLIAKDGFPMTGIKPVPQPVQKTKDAAEQISLFDFGGSGKPAGSMEDFLSEREIETEPMPAPKPNIHIRARDMMPVSSKAIIDILRTGGCKTNSRKRIYAKYQQNKTPEEMVTFLQKEYGECGKGFTFGKSMPISVWFDKDGMCLHYGQSARVPQAAILPWDEAEEFIRTMVQNGTYMNADEITQIKEVECKRVADSVLYFMRDVEGTFSNDLFFLKSCTYPDAHVKMTASLMTTEGADQIFYVVEDTINKIRSGALELRCRHYYNRMDDILEDLRDLRKQWIEFPMGQDVEVKEISFITQDEIDHILIGGSNFANGKKRTYDHFMQGLTPEENIKFLKQEYGNGGASHALPGCDNSWKDYDGKGLHLRKGNILKPSARIDLTYTMIEKRIRELIKSGRYTIENNDVAKTTLVNLGDREKADSAEVSEVSAQPKQDDEPLEILPMDEADQCDLTDWQSIQETVSDGIQEALSDLIPDALPEGAASYKVGDTVYLDDTAFIIQEIGLFDIHLSDPTLSYPIDRTESKERFDALLKKDQRNAHLFESNKPVLREKAGTPINFHWSYDPEEETEAKGFSPKEKFVHNVVAIRILQKIEEENRYATPYEQELLSKYVGWGGLADAFDETKSTWSSEYQELKGLLTPAEYDSARASTLSAHYTSPILIKYIYDALEKFGFQTGNILEPAMGIGNFFALLPEQMRKSKLYGVELDSISGRIAKQLYPLADIKICGFEETNFPNNFFDVAIGNVPFGDFKVSDRDYDKHNFLIHDFFFAKALDKVRPGGIVIFITSKGTMDKKNSSVRRYIGARAELLGAIRLPNTAFKASANTEVTSDILFLKKRAVVSQDIPDWAELSKTPDGIEVNKYFAAFPEMIMGNMEMVSGPHGMQAICSPYPDLSMHDLLHTAVRRINGQIETVELDEDFEGQEDDSIPADPEVKDFSFTLVDDKVYFREGSKMYPLKTTPPTELRVRGMMQLRDCVYELIDAMMLDQSDADIRAKQHQLNTLYDRFVKKCGRLTALGNRRAFDNDGGYPLLSALEILDDEGHFIGKADMFHKRTIKPSRVITSVDTSSEALAVALSEKGRIDFPYMSRLTGKEEQTLIEELAGMIFLNPLTEKWETADEYLSGTVVQKLTIARKFAETDQRFQINVKSLEQVQPKKLDASEIEIRLGATWVDPHYIEDFLRDVFRTSPLMLGRTISVIFSNATGRWNITGKTKDFSNPVPTKTYGTNRLNGYELLESCLNLRDAKVYDYYTDDEGKTKAVLNKSETLLAVTKQETIKEAFKDWIFRDQTRRQELCEKYNALFNTRRPRVYDGSHLQFHGMSPDIEMKPHQKNAVARILYGNNTLLAHCVGAGKTFEMAAAAMELRYLGICNKPMFVVPNHLTEQWASEFLRLYPGAKILATRQKDFETKNRKRFCSRIATGDYDAVIIGHSQFEKIPISAERQAQMLERQIDELQTAIFTAEKENGGHFTVKQMESMKKKLQERLKRLNENSRKDAVITFEQLGVDQLFVDESHNFKNLFCYTKMSNVAGVATTEAKKSTDMFNKCQYLDEITGGRGVTFATGTPLSNSMTELYTNMRYLQYNTLMSMGLGHFDSWASTFGETRTVVELAPEGTGYQAKTRFSRFYNLPELISLFKECADIQTAEMLNLPRPKPEYVDVLLKPSDLQREMVLELGERAEKIRNGCVDSSSDNMLKVVRC